MVARLLASLSTIRRRLEGRETGRSLEWHQRRAAELQVQMEHLQIGDLTVETEGDSRDRPRSAHASELAPVHLVPSQGQVVGL